MKALAPAWARVVIATAAGAAIGPAGAVYPPGLGPDAQNWKNVLIVLPLAAAAASIVADLDRPRPRFGLAAAIALVYAAGYLALVALANLGLGEVGLFLLSFAIPAAAGLLRGPSSTARALLASPVTATGVFFGVVPFVHLPGIAALPEAQALGGAMISASITLGLIIAGTPPPAPRSGPPLADVGPDR